MTFSFTSEPIVTVEVSENFVNSDSPIGESECQFDGFTAENFRTPLTLEEFNWGWKKHINFTHGWAHGYQPWMSLELGSYEQVRMIFDYHADSQYHDTAVNVIHACNRVLEERYNMSASTVGNFETYCDYINEYCDEGSNKAAAYLRSGCYTDDDVEYVKEMIESMDSHMNKSSSFNGNVWRGMKLPFRDFVKFRENGSILFKNFVSTSLAPIMWNHGIVECRALHLNRPINKIEYAEGVDTFVRHVRINMNIDCSGIKHIIPGRMTAYGEECEVILDRNTVIIIDEIFEYMENPLERLPICFIRARAVPLTVFNGTTLVV